MTVKILRMGMRLHMPSGNVITLVEKQGEEWLCLYEQSGREQGEVSFTAEMLRRWAIEIPTRRK